MEKIRQKLKEEFMSVPRGDALWKKTGVRTPFHDERFVVPIMLVRCVLCTKAFKDKTCSSMLPEKSNSTLAC